MLALWCSCLTTYGRQNDVLAFAKGSQLSVFKLLLSDIRKGCLH